MHEGTDTAARDTAPDELLDAAQVAERLGLDPQSGAFVIRVLTAAGDGPATAMSAAPYFWASAVEEWKASPYTNLRVDAEVVAHVLVARSKPRGPRTKPTPANGVPIQCAPWCTDGNGHEDATYREDQICYSTIHRIDLSLADELAEGGTDFLEVHTSEGPSRLREVAISRSGETETRMTPAEARTLIDRLSQVVEC